MALLKITRRWSEVLPCDPALVYEILTDYDRYFEWMPFVSKSKLLAVEGDLGIAEFTISRPKPVRLVVECIHGRNRMVLGRTIGGELPVSRIEWNLAPADQNRVKVSLAIEIHADWRWAVPSYWGLLDAGRCGTALKSYLGTYVPELAGEDGEMLLELTETSEGPVLWFQGKRYILTEAPEEKS